MLEFEGELKFASIEVSLESFEDLPLAHVFTVNFSELQ